MCGHKNMLTNIDWYILLYLNTVNYGLWLVLLYNAFRIWLVATKTGFFSDAYFINLFWMGIFWIGRWYTVDTIRLVHKRVNKKKLNLLRT